MNLYTLTAMIHGRTWAIQESYADSFLSDDASVDVRGYVEGHKEIVEKKDHEWNQFQQARMDSRESTGSFFEGMLSQNGVLTLTLSGVVTEKTSSFEPSGIVVGRVQTLLEMAYNDNTVKGLSVIVTTPGGIALPSLNLGENFVQFAEKKPYYAYAHSLLASAGLSIVSAADVSVSPHVIYGGLATVMRFYDQGRRLKAMGVDYIAVASAPDKIGTEAVNEDGSMHPDSLAKMQDEINQIGAGFNRQIKKMRGITGSASFDSGGYFYSGKDAVKSGLANQVVPTARSYRSRVETAMAKYNKGQK
jgi:ClpP class serine protease